MSGHLMALIIAVQTPFAPDVESPKMSRFLRLCVYIAGRKARKKKLNPTLFIMIIS